jgi:hypothetical protein
MRVGFSVVCGATVEAVAMAHWLAFVAVCSMALAATGPQPSAAQPNEPHPTAVTSVSLPVAPTAPAVMPPMVTSALLPGHWRLEGAQYVWVPPDKVPRPVEYWPLIEGRFVFDWGDGKWVWTPPHNRGD